MILAGGSELRYVMRVTAEAAGGAWRLFAMRHGFIDEAYMSMWLVFKAVILTAVILVTIPFVVCLLWALWGRNFALVMDRNSWLAQHKRPAIREMIGRFVV